MLEQFFYNFLKLFDHYIYILFFFKLVELNRKNADIKNEHLQRLCLVNTYIIELLDSYGFKDLSNIKISKDVKYIIKDYLSNRL